MTILKKIYKTFLFHKHSKSKLYCIYCGSEISFFRVIIKYNQCAKCEKWWKSQHKFILLYGMDEIKTTKEYKVFLKLAETLIYFDPCRETPLGELLILIGEKIEKYESEKFKML